MVTFRAANPEQVKALPDGSLVVPTDTTFGLQEEIERLECDLGISVCPTHGRQ